MNIRRPNSPVIPLLDSVFRLRVSTLHHVPKAARDAWAHVFGEVVQTICLNPSSEEVWVKFLMLAKCILANPPRGGRCRWRDTQKGVQARLAKWRAEEIVYLWERVIEDNTQLNRRLQKRNLKSPSNESVRSANAHRARHAVENGQYRRAIQSLLPEGFAWASSEVLDEMLSKHPQSGPPPIPVDPVPPPVQVVCADIVRALRSFLSGTAPGPSCLRANHVKEAVFSSSPDHANFALQGLVRVVNLLCAGRAPPCILPYLCGATLLACRKRSGGLCPIAIGEVLRRLTTQCVSRAVQVDAIGVLLPLQVGLGYRLAVRVSFIQL